MTEHVEVVQHGHSWRWRYVCADGSGEPVRLSSNTAVGSMQQAVDAARTAYPHLPVRLPRQGELAAHPARRRRLRQATVLAIVLGAAGVAHRLRQARGRPAAQPVRRPSRRSSRT